MRHLGTGFASLVLVSACSAAQPSTPAPGSPEPIAYLPSDPAGIFYFIDGRTASVDAVQQLTHDDIERILILKGDAAIERYGPEAAAGAMLVTSRRATPVAPARQASDRNERVFFFIDGRTATRAEVERFPRNRIDRILILQGPAAVARFGAEAEAGAMLVTSKRNS